jgi:hypothetical protein
MVQQAARRSESWAQPHQNFKIRRWIISTKTAFVCAVMGGASKARYGSTIAIGLVDFDLCFSGSIAVCFIWADGRPFPCRNLASCQIEFDTCAHQCHFTWRWLMIEFLGQFTVGRHVRSSAVLLSCSNFRTFASQS